MAVELSGVVAVDVAVADAGTGALAEVFDDSHPVTKAPARAIPIDSRAAARKFRSDCGNIGLLLLLVGGGSFLSLPIGRHTHGPVASLFGPA
ncbi:hypothetical protein FNH05_35945 [Amycolatopsis rhizosphaerae]|uniref:Uncharacterized protein n=1 Tax=Amycolatopsis rhizosphaerae TaxID=2053003 RepID=A0A558A019_9PSEU|nr:hypothetical protein [Amycolatopsis rhizosphaerae]TVT17610.1 hypothetical protein FNH05_35945 [Amycolatopsis rhizosphaerae]